MKKRFDEKDLKLFEQLVSSNQLVLKKSMTKYLKKKYTKVIETPEYVLAEGDIPIALIAHLDTVFDKTPVEMFYDREKNVLWSPQGLGADDRAGIFAIIKIIQSGLRPHIIFTTDEEIGGVGARKLATIDCPFKDLRYIIQLDRRGFNDCVFYDCANEQFTKYVEEFGFKEANGSFSDISFICPAWKVAGVNLSVGYKDEHSFVERLYVSPLKATIEKVKIMLQEEEIPFFKFVYDEYMQRFYNLYGIPGLDVVTCSKCNKEFLEEEIFPVKDLDGKTIFLCPDCLVSSNVNWCSICGEGFKTNDSFAVWCDDCRDRIFNEEMEEVYSVDV